MDNSLSRIQWDDLVDDLIHAKFGVIKETRRDGDDMSNTGSEASKHSQISQYYVTPQERKTIRALDNHRCFVTNAYSHRSEIAYILGNRNAENRKLASVLPSVWLLRPD